FRAPLRRCGRAALTSGGRRGQTGPIGSERPPRCVRPARHQPRRTGMAGAEGAAMGGEGEGRGAGAGLTASGWLRGPRIFDLSPPGLGADWLARLARANRIEPFEDQPGGLAIRIEHGVARREAPALGPGNARFFTGLDCTHRYPLPPLPAWRRFRYLRRHFRQAVFLLVIRDPDE